MPAALDLPAGLVARIRTAAAVQGQSADEFSHSAIETHLALLGDLVMPGGPAELRATENFATCERVFAQVVTELKSNEPDVGRIVIGLNLLEQFLPTAIRDLRTVLAGAAETVGNA